MKIIAIGDIHGRNSWYQIVHSNEYDKVIFVGDYFDSRENIPTLDQIHNFNNLITFKKENPEKVVLLFGNHDFHYLTSADEQYSGYQYWSRFDIVSVLNNAIQERLVQMVHIHEKFLFCHAGLTKTWLKNTGHEDEPIEDYINDLFFYQPKHFRFKAGSNASEIGDDITQSPIWVRPGSLVRDSVEGFVQVVGHTPQSRLRINPEHIFIDTLGTSGEYLFIQDDQPFSKLV